VSPTLHLSSVDAHALWAPSYDRNPNPILSLEERTVEPLLSRMEGLDALDVACGTGRWLERLLQRNVSTAFGVDLSKEMLEQARTKSRLAGRLIETDAAAMPLRESSIDFAICSFGLSYVAEASRLAVELARVVKDKGTLILSDFHPAAQARGWKRSFRHRSDVVEIVSFSRSVEQVQKTFEREGFTKVASFELPFGDAERPIFEACGKAALLGEVLGQLAIYVFVFRR